VALFEANMLEPGTLIGRYEIQRRLGRGGMGSVYVAHDPQLGRMVAIKVLAGDVEEAESLERFKREARSAAALNHPNLVTVYDFDRFESQPYLVMEYVPGRTMAEVIRRKDAITIGEKLRWLEDLCTGAGYAHRMSVVHRDIKPANLMITRSGQLKILDFGIARMLGITSNTGSMIGTPGYMAPEQIEGDTLDHRADLFSIGVVCYELLSYREAFPGETLPAITHSVLSREPVPLPKLVSDLHPDLVTIVERALRKNKDERFENTESMRGAIARVRQMLETDATHDAVTTYLTPSPAAPRQSDARGSAPRPSGATPFVGSSGTPQPERVRTDREALARLRATQLDAALQRSRTLVSEGSLQEALEQCHIALTFDEAHAEALDLEQSIQGAIGQKAAELLLEEGRELVGRGSLTEARSRLERARELATDVGPIKRFERELRHAVVDQERLRKRAETVSGMVRSARAALDAGQVEEALASAREALALDAASETARAVEVEALRLLEETGPLNPIAPPALPSDATVVRPSQSMPVDATVVRPSPVPPPSRPQIPVPPAAARPGAMTPASKAPRDPLAWARPVLQGLGPAMARAGRSVREGAVRVRTSLPDGRALTTWPPRGMALAIWGVVGVAVVALAVAAALMLRPPAEEVPTGTVVVDALPWGTITAIKRETGESVPLPEPATTPLSITLPEGTYQVQLAGPDSGPSRTLTVRVERGVTGTAPVERFLPPSVDDYFVPYLSVPPATPEANEPTGAPATGGAGTLPVGPAPPAGADR
jgi:serine/threonine-protein kinase